MKTKSKWMPAAIAAVVISLVTATLEPAALANGGEEGAPASELATQKAAPASELATQKAAPASPDKSLVLAARQVVAQSIAQTQPTSAATPLRPPSTPKPQERKSKSKKWILIAVAAGGAATTAAFLARGDNPPPPPATIVVGAPIVGAPQ